MYGVRRGLRQNALDSQVFRTRPSSRACPPGPARAVQGQPGPAFIHVVDEGRLHEQRRVLSCRVIQEHFSEARVEARVDGVREAGRTARPIHKTVPIWCAIRNIRCSGTQRVPQSRSVDSGLYLSIY